MHPAKAEHGEKNEFHPVEQRNPRLRVRWQATHDAEKSGVSKRDRPT